MHVYLHITGKFIRLCKWNMKAESTKGTKKEGGRIHREGRRQKYRISAKVPVHIQQGSEVVQLEEALG